MNTNTGDTDWLDELLNKYVANYSLGVLNHRQSGQQTVKAAITKKLRSERLDELNRAAFTIVSTLYDDIDNLFDHSDIQEVFEAYQKLRAIGLQANKEELG